MEKLDGRFKVGQVIETRFMSFTGPEILISIITDNSYVNADGVSQYVCMNPETGHDHFRGSADEIEGVLITRRVPLTDKRLSAKAIANIKMVRALNR